MKKLLWLVIACQSLLWAQSDQYSIAFIHIGPNIPVYVKDGLEQARLFNPEASIYLVANHDAVKKNKGLSAVVTENNITIALCENLPRSEAHSTFLKNTKLDSSFREGFWLRASERFFYLQELITHHSLRNVFHLENDVMLYADLKLLLPVFEQAGSIAATFDNDIRCIPGFIYFADQSSITCLVDFMSKQAALNVDDMHIIAQYWHKSNRSAITLLPIIMSEYVEQHSLRDSMGRTPKNSQLYFELCTKFNSIFDAAALGQYLGGIDPRNDVSKPGFINETCYFNPSYLKFVWERDEKDRKVPYALFGKNKYRINNLHIHSKKLHEFKS